MGATFARSRTFVANEILTAVNLNAVETNILNNFTPAGMDDYSANVTEMRVTTDPYPAAAESLATSLQGELERLRYVALQKHGLPYYYSDVYPDHAEGAAIASATTTDIWAAYDGATKHITGTTTITSFGTAPQAGCWMKLIFDGALIIQAGGNLITQGAANIQTLAGDIVLVYAETTTQMRVVSFNLSGWTAFDPVSSINDANDSGAYRIEGRTMFIYINVPVVASTATPSFTFTIPVLAPSIGSSHITISYINTGGGLGGPGHIELATGSSTATVYGALSHANWDTLGNGMGLPAQVFMYRL